MLFCFVISTISKWNDQTSNGIDLSWNELKSLFPMSLNDWQHSSFFLFRFSRSFIFKIVIFQVNLLYTSCAPEVFPLSNKTINIILPIKKKKKEKKKKRKKEDMILWTY
jgi:hypothetical protein